MKKLSSTKVKTVPETFGADQDKQRDDRYGSLARDRDHWRIAGLGMIIICIVLSFGYVNQVREGKYIPFMITPGELGTAVVVQPASRVKGIPEKIIVASLGRIIYTLRTVSVDSGITQAHIIELYSFLNKADPAYNKINTYMQDPKNDPYIRAKNVVVQVSVLSVIHMDSGEWLVEWREDVHSREGVRLPELSGSHQAVISLLLKPASVSNDQELRINNPLGIYVRNITWQQEKK